MDEQAKVEYRGKAIIPCAGKGSRVGSPADGKEMMLDPRTNEPLINWSLGLARELQLKPVCILSTNKTKLAFHIRTQFPDADIIFHNPTQFEEWPHSVLASAEEWDNGLNLLILPDTRFTFNGRPTLDKYTPTFFTHMVNEPQKFGVVLEQTGGVLTAEKPEIGHGMEQAWGAIAFSKLVGTYLFTGYSTRNLWVIVPDAKVEKLTKFKDITRNGVVEEY
jgi:dTDP-glucose pyrophosphorylase